MFHRKKCSESCRYVNWQKKVWQSIYTTITYKRYQGRLYSPPSPPSPPPNLEVKGHPLPNLEVKGHPLFLSTVILGTIHKGCETSPHVPDVYMGVFWPLPHMEMIDAMEEHGDAAISHASPVVLVLKKDGSLIDCWRPTPLPARMYTHCPLWMT